MTLFEEVVSITTDKVNKDLVNIKKSFDSIDDAIRTAAKGGYSNLIIRLIPTNNCAYINKNIMLIICESHCYNILLNEIADRYQPQGFGVTINTISYCITISWASKITGNIKNEEENK